MTTADFDLFIIGAGSGGVRAARLAAQRGVRVAVAESAALGGTCVNLGCIPKKLYSFAAHYAESFEEAHGFGWQLAAPKLDWQALKRNRAVEIARLNDIYDKLLGNAGVTLFEGRARLVGPEAVEVNGQVYRARQVLIATGGWPTKPDVPGGEFAISSNEVFDLAEFPRRLVSSVAVTSPANSRRSSKASAPRSFSSIATTRSCAASTTTCGHSSPTKCARRASTCAPVSASSALRATPRACA